jgi:hypothetical protein
VHAIEALLRRLDPDIVHIFGTEGGHAHATAQACTRIGVPFVVGLQGLSSTIAQHYTSGLPASVTHGFTVRDLVRRDNVAMQASKYRDRGRTEARTLALTRFVIGRTSWDRAVAEQLNPKARYFAVPETLRSAFYTNEWSHEACRHQSIFVSQGHYPIKGLHFVLRALPAILTQHPDTQLFVSGWPLRSPGLTGVVKQTRYATHLRRLIRTTGLEDRVHFVGVLDEAAMVEQYLSSHVFVSASTVENESNSLSEAKLLGCPPPLRLMSEGSSTASSMELQGSSTSTMLPTCSRTTWADCSATSRCVKASAPAGGPRAFASMILRATLSSSGTPTPPSCRRHALMPVEARPTASRGPSQVVSGAALSYLGIGLAIASGIFVTPILVGHLGRSQYGLFTLSISIVTLLTFDLGLNSAVARFVAKSEARSDRAKTLEALSVVRRVYLFLDLLLLGVLVTVWLSAESLFPALSDSELQEFRVLFAVAGAVMFLNFPLHPANGTLQGLGRFVALRGSDVVWRAAGVAVTLAVVSADLATVWLVLGVTLVALVTSIYRAVVCIRAGAWRWRMPPASTAMRREITRYTSWSFFVALGQRLMITAMPAILAATAGTHAVTAFAIAALFEGYLWLIGNAVNGLFLPHVSRLVAADDKDALQGLMERVGRFQLLVVGLCVSGFIVFGRDIPHPLARTGLRGRLPRHRSPDPSGSSRPDPGGSDDGAYRPR